MRYTRLAIVVPAYKIEFFRATLESLANQTCKDFTVYIGDDYSPADFLPLINEYIDKIDIVYKRFENNLGGKDLVAQWTRCIEMTQGEPWIWLFSDDDVMGERCVELFYNEINNRHQYDLYHFDVKIVDANSNRVYTTKPYPEVLGSLDFYTKRYESFVVEYIFSRDIYDKLGGFVNFDLAWGSDRTTWVKFGNEKGIKTIHGDFVFWRKSNINITPNNDYNMACRKMSINMDTTLWYKNYFNDLKVDRYVKYVVFRLYVFYSFLSKVDMNKILSKAVSNGLITDTEKKLLITFLPIISVIYKIKKSL